MIGETEPRRRREERAWNRAFLDDCLCEQGTNFGFSEATCVMAVGHRTHHQPSGGAGLPLCSAAVIR